MKRFLGLFTLLITFTSFTANADVLIEPLVGYQLVSKMDVQKGDNYSGGSGPAYGGRLGYQKMGFQVGLDYLNSTLDFSDKDFKPLKSSEWGAFVGFEFPILFRVYAGYIFSATGTTKVRDQSSGSYYKTDFNSGTGFKAGLGFTLLPFLDINLEYRRVTYDDWKFKSSSGSVKMTDDISVNAYMLSLSLPFQL
jgi:hypothetical protein